MWRPGLQPSLSPLQSYYAARASEYDRVYLKPERQFDLRQIEQWLPSVLAGATVLEVACGTGYWTRFLAPVASAVVALDSSPETLRIARERVVAPNTEFHVGDAYALPRFGHSFSAAFAGFWFSHVPLERRREFLLGLNSALAPRARVVLLDNLFVAGSSSAITERDANGNTYQRRSLSDGSIHRVLKNFPTEAQLRALVEAGLGESPIYRTWQYYWAFEYRVPGP
jgi:demethylmenaquinone methyltransferase/2-methoxy-6-polyprenyl-1,4-benzoquinol methylase